MEKEGLSLFEKIAVNGGLALAYVLIIASVGLILYFSVKDTIQHPGHFRWAARRIGVLAVLFLIGWVISLQWEVAPEGVTPANSRLISGALVTMYFLLGIGILTIVFFELKRLIKRDA